MTQVSLDRFVSRIASKVPFAPQPVIVNDVRDVIRDFCSRTNAWTEEGEMEQNTREFNMVPYIPAECEIVNFIWLQYLPESEGASFVALSPIQDDRMQNRYNITPSQVERTGITRYSMRDELTVFLDGIPDREILFRYKVALRPCQDANAVGSQIYTQWCEGVVAGAMSRLLSMSGADWYNRRAAIDYETQYNQEINKAASRAKVSQNIETVHYANTGLFQGAI